MAEQMALFGDEELERLMQEAEGAVERTKGLVELSRQWPHAYWTGEGEAADMAVKAGDTHRVRDFGSHIGGARKEEWAGRGLTVADLDRMNGAEMGHWVRKEEAWPRPDWQALADQGVPREVLWWQKRMRDAMPPRPSVTYAVTGGADAVDWDDVWSGDSARAYVELMTEVRGHVMGARTVEGIVAARDWLWYGSGIFGKNGVVDLMYGAREDPYMGQVGYVRALYKAYDCASTAINPETLLNEANFRGFCLREPEEWAEALVECWQVSAARRTGRGRSRHVEVMTADGRHDYIIPDRDGTLAGRLVPGTWCSEVHRARGGQGYLRARGVATREEAHDIAYEDAIGWVRSKGSDKGAARRRKRLVPPMLEDVVREGGDDVRRGWHMRGAEMGKAYGLRGGEYGNWLSDEERQASLDMAYDAFHDLAVALGVTDESIGMGGRLAIAFGARGRGGSAMAHYEPDRDVINLTKTRGAGSLAHEWAHSLDDIAAEVLAGGSIQSSDHKKDEGLGEGVWTGLREAMERAPGGGRTQFYEDARALDDGYARDSQGYWASPREMFARATAAWVEHRLALLGIRDDYLCGHALGTVPVRDGAGGTRMASIAPRGEELERIGTYVQRVVGAACDRGLMELRGPRASVAPQAPGEDGPSDGRTSGDVAKTPSADDIRRAATHAFRLQQASAGGEARRGPSQGV